MSDQGDALQGENRPIWKGNWWVVGSGLSIWFTAGHGIPYLVRLVTPLFAIHLVNACLVSWICIANLFHSPSHGPRYRVVHIWLGRLALVFGTLSTILGFATVWHERYSGVNAFSIGISIGGTIQVVAQYLAVYVIRRGHVRRHMIWNHAVFYGGCLISAIMRLPGLIHADLTPYWSSFSWIFPLILGALSFRAVSNNSYF